MNCARCKDGFVSHYAINNCIADSVLDPVVMSVTHYTFHSVPTACADGYILHDNKCQFVDVKFENCAIPDFADTVNFTCIKCKPGFYLNSGKTCETNLEATLGSNCSQLAEDNSCSRCKDTFSNVKFHSVQKLICESNVTIANCLVYNTAKQGNCAICQNGYLAGDKTCETVATAPSGSLITNCDTYEYDRCKQCKTGFVRTLDGKECVEVAGLDAAKTDIKAGTRGI